MPPGIFLVNGILSYIPTPSSDRICSNHWSLTLSGTPVVKHSAPNLCEQSSQCVGLLQAPETWMVMMRMMIMIMMMNLSTIYFKDFSMPLDDCPYLAYTRAPFAFHLCFELLKATTVILVQFPCTWCSSYTVFNPMLLIISAATTSIILFSYCLQQISQLYVSTMLNPWSNPCKFMCS